MADTYYAWSPIRYGGEVDKNSGVLDPKSVKTISIGDSVTKDKLSMSDADWDALVEGGSVRTQKPPDVPDGWQGSLMDYWRQQIREADQPLDTTGGTHMLDEVERQKVAAEAQAEIDKAESAGASKSK